MNEKKPILIAEISSNHNGSLNMAKKLIKCAKENGADAVMTPRSMDVVEMLAKEDVPVMGHLGLVPRKSTWIGGLRAVGKTADEAYKLFQNMQIIILIFLNELSP